jgi:sec-independent protein translocase protein TatA
MLGDLTGWHLVIILAVVLLLFGAAKLPALAKAVGQSAKIFKSEVKGLHDDDAKPGVTVESTATPAAAAAAAATLPQPAPLVTPAESAAAPDVAPAPVAPSSESQPKP